MFRLSSIRWSSGHLPPPISSTAIKILQKLIVPTVIPAQLTRYLWRSWTVIQNSKTTQLGYPSSPVSQRTLPSQDVSSETIKVKRYSISESTRIYPYRPSLNVTPDTIHGYFKETFHSTPNRFSQD